MTKEKILRILKNLAAIIVIFALIVIIFYQNRDRDIFKFGKSESNRIVDNSAEDYGNNTYEKSSTVRVGDMVAFLAPSTLTFYNEKAEGEKQTVALSTPIMNVCGEYLAIYEEKNTEVIVYKNKNKSYSVNLENKVIKAKVNSGGYLFVATEKDGYNCECMVYNKKGDAIFKWDISKSEFIDGVVNGTNDAIAISVATAEENKLFGEVMLIDVTTAEVINKHRSESQLYYSITTFKNGTYAAFSGKELSFFNSDGTQKWKYGFEEKVLAKANIDEADMMVLAFSPGEGAIGGNTTEVKVLNRLGKIVAEKTYSSGIDDVAVTENAIAMVFGKNVVVADRNLHEIKTVENESIVKKIALFSDNKHLFVIGNSESKIIK